jgi:hypothetical protein
MEYSTWLLWNYFYINMMNGAANENTGLLAKMETQFAPLSSIAI